ncbi:MAG TPA: arylamine N-acetyltransferase [Devosiaceae bacterium]|nr:arylamine N-acetyltransferase [Devosiaceae bacterium]
MSEDVKLTAYFERIGFAGSIAPTLATLEALHGLQPAAIPFENFNSLLGLPVPLDQASLNQKLLTERRGGYCFELNLMLLRVLRELGFEARGHLATVLWGAAEIGDATPDHMLITTDILGTTYLADVGFGGLLLTAPLQLEAGLEQTTPLGHYRLTGEDPALRLEARRNGEWWPAYQFSLAEIDDATYAEVNGRLNADPEWFLRQHLLVERAAPDGRQMVFDGRLTTGGPEGEREDRLLATVADIRETLTTGFSLDLPAADGLDTILARLLAHSTAAG